MKWRVFFLTFTFPILVVILLIIAVKTDRSRFDVFVPGLLLLIAFGRILLSDRKYVYSVSINGTRLNIHESTPYFKFSTVEIPFRDIVDTEMKKANWITDFMPTVTIKTRTDSFVYHIPDKEIFLDIQDKLRRELRAEAV